MADDFARDEAPAYTSYPATAHTSAPQPASQDDDLVADLREHRISFVLPAGAVLSGNLDNQGGALIQGKFTGNIHCREGSLIIARGGEFSGRAEADSVYIEGTVRSIQGANAGPSILRGRLLAAISELAVGVAELHSRDFAIHSRKFVANLRYIKD